MSTGTRDTPKHTHDTANRKLVNETSLRGETTQITSLSKGKDHAHCSKRKFSEKRNFKILVTEIPIN